MASFFDSLRVYHGSYEVVGSEKLTEREVARIQSITVRESMYGPSLCFMMSGGMTKYIPMKESYGLCEGDTVEPKSVVINKLTRVGDPTPIYRATVELD